MGIILVTGLMLWVLTCHSAIAKSSGGDLQTILVDKAERTVLVHVPPNSNQKELIPLVIVLHGGGGNAENIINTSGMNAKADKENFVVAYPGGTGRARQRLTWNAGHCCGYAAQHDSQDIRFISELIDALQQEYPIDPKRIYVAGMSNGGMMAYRIGIALSHRVAAIGVVSGAMFGDEPNPRNPVSVIIFHGTEDEHVPFAGGQSRNKLVKRNMDKPFLPVMDAFNFWSQADACAKPRESSRSGNVEIFQKRECRSGSAVVLYKIYNAGHAWPGGKKGGFMMFGGDEPSHDIIATDVMWTFFKNQHR